VVFAFSGRIEEQQLPELASLLEADEEHHEIVFDLAEVRLVHRRVVRFLGECEARGIRLENCPSYIRKWIETGSDNEHEPEDISGEP
jgi:hypothetical protein